MISLLFATALAQDFTPTQLWQPPWGRDVTQVALGEGGIATVHCAEACHVEVRATPDAEPTTVFTGDVRAVSAADGAFVITPVEGEPVTTPVGTSLAPDDRVLLHFPGGIAVPPSAARVPDEASVAWHGGLAAWASEGGLTLWTPATGGRLHIATAASGFAAPTAHDEQLLFADPRTQETWLYDGSQQRNLGAQTGAAFTPDGDLIVSSVEAGTRRLRDEQVLWTTEVHGSTVVIGESLVFLGAGMDVIALRLSDGTEVDRTRGRLRDAHGDTAELRISGGTPMGAGGGTELWSPGGERRTLCADPVVLDHGYACRTASTLTLHDLQGEVLQTVPLTTGWLVGLAPDGSALVLDHGERDAIERWRQGRRIARTELPEDLLRTDVADPASQTPVSPDGRRVVYAVENTVFEVRPGRDPRPLGFLDGPVVRLQWSGKREVLAASETMVATFQNREKWRYEVEGELSEVVPTEGQLWVVSGGRAVHLDDKGQQTHAHAPEPVRQARFTAPGMVLVRADGSELTVPLPGAAPLDGEARTTPQRTVREELQHQQSLLGAEALEPTEPLAQQGARALVRDAPGQLSVLDLRTGRFTHRVFLGDHAYAVLSAEGTLDNHGDPDFVTVVPTASR